MPRKAISSSWVWTTLTTSWVQWWRIAWTRDTTLDASCNYGIIESVPQDNTCFPSAIISSGPTAWRNPCQEKPQEDCNKKQRAEKKVMNKFCVTETPSHQNKMTSISKRNTKKTHTITLTKIIFQDNCEDSKKSWSSVIKNKYYYDRKRRMQQSLLKLRRTTNVKTRTTVFARSTWAAVWNSGIHNITNRITKRMWLLKKMSSDNAANLTPIHMDVAKSQLLRIFKSRHGQCHWYASRPKKNFQTIASRR